MSLCIPEIDKMSKFKKTKEGTNLDGQKTRNPTFCSYELCSLVRMELVIIFQNETYRD